MRRQRMVIRNEFAAVALELQNSNCGPRLEVVDLEHGLRTYFDPLELASLCAWPEHQRFELLNVGAYDPEGLRPADDEWEMG